MQDAALDSSPRAIDRRQNRTYTFLTLAAVLIVVTLSPPLLVAFGLLGVDSLQGASTITGIVFGPLAFLALIVAAVFSLKGLVGGPAVLRLRIAAWWISLAGSLAVSSAVDTTVSKIYFGMPYPGLGISDLIIAVGLILIVVFPLVWKIRMSKTVS